MVCPHCLVSIHEDFFAQAIQRPSYMRDNVNYQNAVYGKIDHQQCPACHELIVKLDIPKVASFIAFPKGSTRPIHPDVTDPYRSDFREAALVLTDSPKASAALSRRCLQAILRDKAQTGKKDLNDQIEEVIASGKLPTHIVEGLHAVRNIGNFAAHVTKSTSTGTIIDVEPGEAEWNLEVLEALFDFYFVQPALTAKRRAELNAKLRAAGKPELP